MSSTNKTTYYELPQFVDSDFFNPLVDDNDAYNKIDTALHQIAEAEADDASEIVGVKSRVTTVEGKVEALETQNGSEALTTVAQTLSGAVNELNNSVVSLDTKMDAVDDDINNVNTGLKVKVSSLESKIIPLNKVYTPEMYGAKRDGVTDDSSAIQSAINNAGDDGVVYLSRGVYRCESGLVLGSNTYLIGESFSETWSGFNGETDRNDFGTVLDFHVSANTDCITMGGSNSIQNITLIGNSFYITENTAPETADTYFNKRNMEVWIAGVNGIKASGAVSGCYFNNVCAIEFSGYGIELPPYSICENIHAKLCNTGINLDKVDVILSNIRVQSCNVGVALNAPNGAQINHGRIEECIVGIDVASGVDITISDIKFDQLSKYAIYNENATNLIVSDILVTRCGQNCATYGSYSDIPAEHSSESTAILTNQSMLVNNITVRKAVYDDGSVNQNYKCPHTVIVGGGTNYKEVKVTDVLPVGFGDLNSHNALFDTIIKYGADGGNYFVKLATSGEFIKLWNDVVLVDNVSTNISTRGIKIGELRHDTTNHQLLISTNASSGDLRFLCVTVEDNDNPTVTDGQTAEVVSVDKAYLRERNLISHIVVKATTTQGYGYTLVDYVSDRPTKGLGFMIAQSDGKVYSIRYADGHIRSGTYSLVTDEVYDIYTF